MKKLIAIILALSLTVLMWLVPVSATEEGPAEGTVTAGETEEGPAAGEVSGGETKGGTSVHHETQCDDYEYSVYQEDLGGLILTSFFGVIAAPMLLFLFPPLGIAGLVAPFYTIGVFFHQLFGID